MPHFYTSSGTTLIKYIQLAVSKKLVFMTLLISWVMDIKYLHIAYQYTTSFPGLPSKFIVV